MSFSLWLTEFSFDGENCLNRKNEYIIEKRCLYQVYLLPYFKEGLNDTKGTVITKIYMIK